jgi:hypothetical protein
VSRTSRIACAALRVGSNENGPGVQAALGRLGQRFKGGGSVNTNTGPFRDRAHRFEAVAARVVRRPGRRSHIQSGHRLHSTISSCCLVERAVDRYFQELREQRCTHAMNGTTISFRIVNTCNVPAPCETDSYIGSNSR